MYIRKIVKSFYILVERIPFLVSDIYRICSSYILDTLFVYKVHFLLIKIIINE